MTAWIGLASLLALGQVPTSKALVPAAETGPRGLRVSFGFGTYTPSVDAELGDATPYEDVFGGSGWMIRPEVGWVAPLTFGQFSLSLSVGYFKKTAKSFKEGSDTRSGGDTSLQLVPVTGLAGLRVNWIEDWTGLPLHPYLELGLSYTFWEVEQGEGRTARTDDATGSGGSPGVVGNLGVALALDQIDAHARRSLRENFGIHGTDLYLEWVYDRTLPLGEERLSVGASTWQLGLQFLF